MLAGLSQPSLCLVRRHAILSAWQGRRLASGQLCSDRQTHLTGLYRSEQADKELASVYRETLAALSLLPADYYYRRSLEETISGRLRLLGEGDRAQAEAAMGEGLLEEVIEQARAELALIQTAAREEWRPWEPLTETAAPT